MKKILLAPLFTAAIAAHAQIYQCGNTLTDQPCEGAKTLASQSVFSAGNQNAESTVYECKKPNERQVLYSTAQCTDGYLQVARHTVPSGVSFKDKVYIIEMRKQGRRALDSQKGGSAGIVPSHVTKRDTPNCKSIDAQIKSLDEQMRAPQSASSMSYLSDQRRKLSDRRFRECR